MSVNQLYHQLQQELQNELTVTNNLLYLISNELKTIKEFTSAGGKFAKDISDNATTMETLCSGLPNTLDFNNISVPREVNTQENNSQNMS